MVEVFKTDVNNNRQAKVLIEIIHTAFDEYKANFDLEDCDRILRVENVNGFVKAMPVIALMESWGVYAEVLPDVAIVAQSAQTGN